MVNSRIVDVDGNPIPLNEIKTAQTAHAVALHREFQDHPSRGLTPSKLGQILIAAEQGDVTAQYELFEDMEEKDAHIMSEMGKRRRAVAGLDWRIDPPRNATAKERDAAMAVREILDGLEDIEDIIFDTTDAIGKGFACQEYGGWHRVDGDWLPINVQHRPQTWFQLVRGFTQSIRLRGAGNGEPLKPFGWIVHTHKAKSGWLERSALFRVLTWPYLFKNYSVGDLAEFLEIYGIPLRLGKYPSGATESEKLTLMRALAQIGHNAAGIIPLGMEIEFENAAQGDPKAFELMMSWCDKAQSKAILGGTLTSQADGKTSTNALGNVHDDVRKELRDGDAKQIAKTLSRDLIYPIAVLNGLADNWRRCPRLVFDTNEPEDMLAFANAAPKLLNIGMRIDRQWAQERVGIPEPEEGAELLEPIAKQAVQQNRQERQAAASAQLNAPEPAQTPADLTGQRVAQEAEQHTQTWLGQIEIMLEQADSLDEFRAMLLAAYPDLPANDLGTLMGSATSAAFAAGRFDVEHSHG